MVKKLRTREFVQGEQMKEDEIGRECSMRGYIKK